MAKTARNHDYIQRNINVEHRVRDLETGVHPTNSDVDFFDSTDWMAADIEPGFQPWISGIDTFGLTFRKRVGIVTLAGGVSNEGGISEDWPAGPAVKVASIPTWAAPDVDMAFMGMKLFDDVHPLIPVTIAANGDIIVRDTQGALQTGSREGVRFDGITYLPSGNPT